MKQLKEILPLSLASLYRAKMRNERRVDKKYTDWIRTQPCAKCQRKPVVVAHQRILGGGGMGLKPSDYDALPLCNECHHYEHQYGYVSLWWDVDKDRNGIFRVYTSLKQECAEKVSQICDKHMEGYLAETGIDAKRELESEAV